MKKNLLKQHIRDLEDKVAYLEEQLLIERGLREMAEIAIPIPEPETWTGTGGPTPWVDFTSTGELPELRKWSGGIEFVSGGSKSQPTTLAEARRLTEEFNPGYTLGN